MRCEHEIDGDRCTKCGARVLDDAGTTEEQRLDLHRWSRAMGVPSPIWRRTDTATPDEGEWPARDAVPIVRSETIRDGLYTITISDETAAQNVLPSFDWSRLACRGAEIMDVTNTVVLHGAPPMNSLTFVPDPTIDWGRVSRGEHQVEVTPEMVAAFRRALPTWFCVDSEIVAGFRAMHALAPVPLVSDGEVRAVRERDEAYCYLRTIFEHVAPQCTPLPDLIGICTQVDNVLAGARIDAEILRGQLAARDARIAELDTMLAQKSAPVVETKPAVVIREHRSDPRRLGLA